MSRENTPYSYRIKLSWNTQEPTGEYQCKAKAFDGSVTKGIWSPNKPHSDIFQTYATDADDTHTTADPIFEKMMDMDL